jgi:N,N'-diacetyllegionaminate synthase
MIHLDIGRARNPCLIIAEAGVNHNGSEELALQLFEIAEKYGTDAIKFLT